MTSTLTSTETAICKGVGSTSCCRLKGSPSPTNASNPDAGLPSPPRDLYAIESML